MYVDWMEKMPLDGKNDCQVFSLAQQGWQCPICKKVYAPHITECYWCNNKKILTKDTLAKHMKGDK